MKKFRDWIELKESQIPINPRLLKSSLAEFEFSIKNRPDLLSMLHKVKPDLLTGQNQEMAQLITSGIGDPKAFEELYIRQSRGQRINPAV